MVDPVSIGAIVVALIAAIGAWASQRAAANAAKYNADAAKMSTKATAELEAFNRARAMDVKTIERQDSELEQIRNEYDELNTKFKQILKDNENLHAENVSLRRRVARLEREKGEISG